MQLQTKRPCNFGFDPFGILHPHIKETRITQKRMRLCIERGCIVTDKPSHPSQPYQLRPLTWKLGSSSYPVNESRECAQVIPAKNHQEKPHTEEKSIIVVLSHRVKMIYYTAIDNREIIKAL